MTYALKQNVIVQPGGVIEVHVPHLAAGTPAEVIVLVEQPSNTKSPLLDLIGIAPGLYGGIEQIDAEITQLREEWNDPA